MEIVEFRKRKRSRWLWLLRGWCPQTFKSSCVTEGLISTAQASQKMRRRTQDEVHNKPAIFILEREIDRQFINKEPKSSADSSRLFTSETFQLWPKSLSKKVCIRKNRFLCNGCGCKWRCKHLFVSGAHGVIPPLSHKTNKIRSSYIQNAGRASRERGWTISRVCAWTAWIGLTVLSPRVSRR